MKRFMLIVMAMVLAIVFSACAHHKCSCKDKKAAAFPYPATKIETVTDNYHGTAVADDYRWLEDNKNPEVIKWTESQNAFTEKFIGSLPQTAKIEARLREIWNFDKMDIPAKKGDRLFYKKTLGLQNQGVLYVLMNGAEKVLVDPNALNKEGTTAMDWWYASPKGKYIAYGLSENGSEQSVLHLMDVETGKAVDTPIPGCRYASVGFMPDETGFYYTRKLDGAGKGELDAEQSIRFHKVGENPDSDAVIMKSTLKEAIMASLISDDGLWLLLMEYKGSSGSAKLWMYDSKKKETRVLVDNYDTLFNGADFLKGRLYLMSNKDNSPNFRIDSVDPATLKWEPVIAHDEKAVLSNFMVTDDKLALLYLKDVVSRLKIASTDGKEVKEITLPVLGSVHDMSGGAGEKELYIRFSSYAYPISILKYNAATPEAGLTLFYRPNIKVDPDMLETKQVFYTSKDGTKVPMFIVHKKGLELNGQNPTMLTGYGGFNIVYEPYFSTNNFVWLEKGGVFAVANIRGGGEYGEKWHQAGMLNNKQNCFDDFAWAMKYLIENKYTNPKKLAVEGGSNGGLLTGAMVTQYSELFSAALIAVPLLDMLRFQKFLIGRYWVSEYGSAEVAEQFPYIYKYSPYHNIKKQSAYPAVLLTAGDSDSRVDPMHSKKMAAMLQRENTSKAPILLWVEMKAGHGQGKSTDARIKEAAMTWGFFMEGLGVNYSK